MGDGQSAAGAMFAPARRAGTVSGGIAAAHALCGKGEGLSEELTEGNY